MAAIGMKRNDLSKNDIKSLLLASPSLVYLYYREAGELKDFVNNYNNSPVLNAKNINGDNISLATLFEAEWHYYTGNVEKAEPLAKQSLHTAREAGQIEAELTALLLLSRIALFTGKITELHKLLDRMEQLERKEIPPQTDKLANTLDICKALFYASMQQPDMIPEWILEYDYAKRLQFGSIAFANMAYGKVLMEHGENLKLLEVADDFYIQAIMSMNLLAVIYTEVYRAVASYRIGQLDVSIEALISALEIAEADHIVMPFVENGKDILPIFEQMGEHGRYQTLIRRIMESYQKSNKSLKIIVDAKSIK